MQLDYIGKIRTPEIFSQVELWTNSKPTKIKSKINYSNVESFFYSICSEAISSEKAYWESITPKSDSEKFKRWLFAFMSVHTSYASNLNGYKAIQSWIEWFNRPEVLKEKLIESRVGLHNLRTRFVSDFSKAFWSSPETFDKQDVETWAGYRNRLEQYILGLGMAKVSFAIEMIYPNQAEVACLDTHLFQAYDLNQTKDHYQYREIEKHWTEMCKMWSVPNYIARCIYWNKKQGKTDSRYWSSVLE